MAATTTKKAAAKKTAAKRVAAKKTAAKKAPATRAAAGGGKIRSWQDDPGSPEAVATPVQSPVPDLGGGRLPVEIEGPRPAPKLYSPGTPEFRYWAAAEALQRGASLWGDLVPAGVTWFQTVGPRLRIGLDEGEDLNAYYDRGGLHFFHGAVGAQTVFSGESPDVACHELGHAVLDALRPQLFEAAFAETAALHESFGDMSAMLAAIQLSSFRQAVLSETGGALGCSSRLSRLAEQLGWAIRHCLPDAVAPDALRNAANSFFYQDPAGLPPAGPATMLSSEPHSFSRLFTAAFLGILAGIHAEQDRQDEEALLATSRDAGVLLVDAVVASPVVPSYFSQVAAHMVEADARRFGGRHGDVLTKVFVRRGILSIDSARAVASAPSLAEPPAPTLAALDAATQAPQPLLPLPGQRFGLDGELLVHAPAEPKRFSVAGAHPDVGPVPPAAQDQAARSFVEDLFRRGDVDVSDVSGGRPGTSSTGARPSSHSHAVVRRPEGLVLERRFFD